MEKSLKKSKMIKKKILIFAFIALLLLCPLVSALPLHVQAATTSRAECVVEVSSRRFLHEINANETLPMASTTKILTALVILSTENPDETVVIPKEAEGTEGSSVYLRAGDEYSVRDLLYGLMLRSGNDCAVTLALHHSGSIESFAEAMNKKAVSLGAIHSHFTNPHGLPDDNHYTTARDLSLIAAEAMENEEFCKIVSCKYYEARGWKNKNKMLWNYDGAVGVKTGFTVKAGRCLVTAAEKEGMKIVSVVLNSPEMFERTAQLLDESFLNYSLVSLCKRGEWNGFFLKYDFIYPLTQAEREKINVLSEVDSVLPKYAGEIAGSMKIYLENRLLFSQNLIMI